MTLKTLRLTGFCAALALAAPAAFAQTTPAADVAAQPKEGVSQPGRGGRMGGGGAMFKDLNLTADQQTKIDAIMRDGRGQRPDGPPTEADRQAMQTRRAEMETKIKAVLTPEQLTKYEALRKERGGMRPANPQ